MNRIAELMSNINDEFIIRAEKKRNINILRITMIAAIICFTFGISFILSNQSKYTIEKIYVSSSATESYSETVTPVKKWDELTEVEQYYFVDYNGNQYDQSAMVSINDTQDYLGTVTAYGIDYWSEDDIIYEKEFEAYSLNKVSTECVIVILIDEDYYVYVNYFYKPETLGDFIDDLNLLENIEFGNIYYNSADNSSIVFDPPLKEKVFELFEDVSIENVENYDLEVLNFKRIMGISIDIEILGYENIALEICEDGYITTNILATGKAFCVGEEKTQAFMDYVLGELDGVKYVYIYEDEEDTDLNTQEDFTEGDSDSSQAQSN